MSKSAKKSQTSKVKKEELHEEEHETGHEEEHEEGQPKENVKSSTLTVDDYDLSKVKFGQESKNNDYGFSKYKMTYPREDVNSNDNIINLNNGLA